MDLIVTLAERDHFYGVFALFNSAVRFGFSGTFVIGYRNFDQVPPHLVELLNQMPCDCAGVRLELVKLETERHFTNYKPDWMRLCLEKWSQTERILYLDPDIMLTCPWSFLARWIDSGVALCADINWHMSTDHPIRHQWREFMVRAGLTEVNKLDYYFNGGFLGLKRQAADFLLMWGRLLDSAGSEKIPLDCTGDVVTWRKCKRWDCFMTPDQDTMNIAAMSWPSKLAFVGPDAMGFANGDLFCPHAIGATKPWQRRYLFEAFLGRRPRIVDINFWDNVSTPVQVFSPGIVRQRKLAMRIALGIGRFYRRAGS